MVIRKNSTIRMAKLAWLILVAGVACPLFATTSPSQNLYQYRLDSLNRFTSFETKKLAGSPSIWIAFQPDCSSCGSQLKDLSCLADGVKKLALGIRGPKKELVKLLRPTNFKGQALMVSPQMIRDFKLEATPTIFIVDQSGQVQKRILGLTECQTLKSHFQTKTPKEI